MKKYIIRILILIAIVGIFSPVFAVAPPNETEAENTKYKLLTPLPGGTEGELSEFDTTEGLGKYLNLIINLVIGISAVLAVVMIVMGGIEYMGSELISEKADGKNKIQNALLGLLIAMGAWALLNTINPNLLNSDVKIDPATVVINISDSVPQTYSATTGLYPNGQLRGAPLFGTPTPLPTGVALNNNGKQCTQVGETGCTSTIGLNMSNVWAIKQGCPSCELVITGGTEWWLHGGQSGSTSHQNGTSTVDLRSNDALDRYLSGGKPLVKYKRYGPNGLYYYEGDHWHIGP